MSNILAIIIVVLGAFIGVTIAYSKVKKISIQKATKEVVKVLKDIYNGLFDKEIQKFILRLGTIDGVHYTIEQIYLVFDEISQLYRTFIFQYYKELDTITLYRFKAKFSHVDFEPLALMELLTSIVEKEVNKVLHNMDIFVITDSYVAIRYHHGMLDIAVAKNEDGFNRIENLKAKAMEEIFSLDEINDNIMTEQWEDTK